MKELALSLGVNEDDIFIDDTSNNTFENIENAMKLLPNYINHISIVTSEFHLKRCYAILKKNYPNISVTMISSKDGFSDRDNWFLSANSWNSGRSLATYETHLLVKYAKENKIYDLENELGIDHKRKKYQSFSLRFLPYLFGKSVSTIHVALHRMKKIFSYPITFEDDGVICVKEEGIRWLYEIYFKRDYLKELEEYKWELEKIM